MPNRPVWKSPVFPKKRCRLCFFQILLKQPCVCRAFLKRSMQHQPNGSRHRICGNQGERRYDRCSPYVRRFLPIVHGFVVVCMHDTNVHNIIIQRPLQHVLHFKLTDFNRQIFNAVLIALGNFVYFLYSIAYLYGTGCHFIHTVRNNAG